ncbi:MAG: hypothetical protein C4526_10355 [Nitrospiraceae bacterium]|nr:MAG: hypothetical protein C4526_10355 [Nitrospiraceae bacterium]
MKKRLTITIGAILAFAVLFFLLRGPYLSNYTKRLIIPALENVTGERVLIDKAVINLLPFYVQAKGLKVFDGDGNLLLRIVKSRVYIDLLGLLSKEIRIRKLTFKEPGLQSDEEDIRRVIGNIRKSMSGDSEQKYRVSLWNVELTDGMFDIKNAKGMSLSGSGVFFEMATKNDISAWLRVNEAVVKSPGLAEIRGEIGGKVRIKDGSIDIAGIDIKSSESYLRAKGEMRLGPEGNPEEGSLSGKAEIREDVLQKFFDLTAGKEGILSFKGRVGMTMDNESKKPRFAVDLETDSSFHLETLMELVKVDEDITGALSVKGKITGIFPELSGSGTAKLRDATLGGLRIDDLSGDVGYGDRKFTLSNFRARAYEGELEGKASVSLPHGDYMVDADITRVGSREFFRFIEWEPPFPAGEISGHFLLTHNHGEDIEVRARADYLNTSVKEGDLPDRLNKIKCGLHLKEGVLMLEDTVLSTQSSDLLLNGYIDLRDKLISLDTRLDSRDISDLTDPYYTKFTAPVTFKGRMKGDLHDPEISGRLEAGPGNIHGLKFTRASADLIYRTSSLTAPAINITDGKASYEAAGTIEFRKAEGLFSFKAPYYKAKAVLKDAGLKPFITELYRDIPVSGSASGTVSFEGDTGNYTAKGDIVVRDGLVYGQRFDKVAVKTVMQPEHMEFYPITAQKGGSLINAKGKLFFDGKFSLSVSSDRVDLSDINLFHGLSIGGVSGIAVEGSGTFEKPDIRFSAQLHEGTFRGVKTGKGEIEGRLKEKDFTARGTFMNGQVTAGAKAFMSPEKRWSVDVDVREGSYDFLLSGLFKTPPEDLALSLEGKVRIKGEGGRVSLLSRFGYLSCTLYGYNFRNAGDLVLELADRNFAIKSFSLEGDHVKLTASGALKPDEQLDIKVKGNLNLAPLKILSDKLVSIKGQGDFSADITGPWDSPDIGGEVNLNDAVLSLTEYPYKAGPLNGTVFLKKDRFIFDSVKAGFGGGSIIMSGIGYLKGVSVKRVFLSSTFAGINIKPLEKVSAVMDGRLFYETSEKGSALSGNVDIKKARYGKDIEWNKWLVNLREISREPVRYPAFLKDTELNVHIAGADNIIIDNNTARAPVQIAVTLTGNVTRPGLIGRVEAREGTIYFRSSEFKILEGSNVDFIDPAKFTPVFHLLAETYTGEYYIKLNLDGTADKFTLALFSDPPLSEMEILNLLTFGQATRDSRGIESGIAASEAASILTGGLQDVVQEKFRGITGFERFRIEPGTTTAGAVAPKVTVGKRLLEDKLFVIYSTSVGTTEESVIRLEYRVDKNISLVGSKDEIGSVGGDVKFRFEFK